MKLLPNWIKNYRIDIYKDLVFWPIATLWLIGNIIEMEDGNGLAISRAYKETVMSKFIFIGSRKR